MERAAEPFAAARTPPDSKGDDRAECPHAEHDSKTEAYKRADDSKRPDDYARRDAGLPPTIARSPACGVHGLRTVGSYDAKVMWVAV